MLELTDRQKILYEWNATERSYPRDSCIHKLFELQAAAIPNAVALVCGEEQLTYGELNCRADRTAHRLFDLGVGPETLVGVLMERSIDMVVGLLGILKAGGAYVPLDPGYPTARLAFMIRDANVPFLLTQPHLIDRLPECGARIVCFGTDWVEHRAASDGRPSLTSCANSLAYIIYTSGSTGEPKGVTIPHRAIVRLVKGTDYVEFGPREVFLQHSPISFDASTFEIWGALLNGSRLVILPPGQLSLDSLGKVLKHYRVTTLWLTAGLFEKIVQERLELLRPVRQLLTGGDVVPVPAVRKVLMELVGCRLVNGYGPTESTTFACTQEVTIEDTRRDVIPIGRPIANTRAYILDEDLEPLQVEKPGELYIGGDGLARGYWNRPELTASRFIAHDFGDGQRQRLYRTGDLARFRMDGTIEFLGRIDAQVKIRGFRVEPGEVEATMRQHVGIREVIVVARGKPPAGCRLLAYFVPSHQSVPRATELRAYLLSRMPDYMVPSAFIALDSLPLTPNGKVDRDALPDPDLAWPEPEKGSTPVQDDVEMLLHRIWEELFERRTGRHDNFFELGGDSLIALCLFGRLEECLGVSLPMTLLYKGPTLAQLAKAIRDSNVDVPWKPLVAIKATGGRRPFFCVHGLSGDVFNFYAISQYLEPDQPFYGLRGLDCVIAPIMTMEAMAQRYLEAISQIQPHGPYLLGGYSAGSAIAFDMARQLKAQGEAVALLVMLDAESPSSLQRTPPWRLAFVMQLLRDLPYSLRLSLRSGSRYLLSLLKRKAATVSNRFGLLHKGPGNRLFNLALRELTESTPYANQRLQFMVAFYRALLVYSPSTYSGTITVLRACEQPLVSMHDPTSGWGEFAEDGVITYPVPGAHLNILKEPYVKGVAKQLQRCLNEAERPSGGSNEQLSIAEA